MTPDYRKKQKLADVLRGIAVVIGVCFFYIAVMSAVSLAWQSKFLSECGGIYSEAEFTEAFNRDSGYINLIFSGLCLLIAAAFFKLRGRSLAEAANIRPAPALKIGVSFTAGLSAQLPLGFLVALIPFSEEVFKGHDELMSASTTPVAVQMLYSIIIAPIIEEVFFRGIAHDRLSRTMNPLLAAVISSLPFALIHGELLSIIVAFAAGFVLAMLYNRYKTILVPISFHMGFNAFGYAVSFISGEAAELTALSVSAVILAVSLVILFRRDRTKNKPQ